MSLDTWMKEFYPTSAEGKRGRVAILHSLQKWKGALPENTEKHDIKYGDYEVGDGGYNYMIFNENSCSLCVAYQELYDCSKCPIVKAGFPSCLEDNSVYEKSENNPKLMIETLEKTLIWFDSKYKKGAKNDRH